MHLMCPHSCGTCAGLWPGPAVPRGEDHAGLFELVHVEPFRMNRLMIYNGHIWHSSFYPLSSLTRLLVRSPMAGRLMLQHGLKVPALQAAFSTWKEIMDAAAEAKKLNFLLDENKTEHDAHRESREAQTEPADPATMSSRQSSSTPAELAASLELASATTAEEPAASISSGAPGFPAQQVRQEEEGYDSEQIASNRHKHEASPETATASCMASAAAAAARYGRARAGKSAAPETREEDLDLDLLLDIEAALGQELPAAPTRRRRSEPWARLRPQRQGGFSSLSDVPDVPVSIDGSAGAGGFDPEDVLANCPDAMTEEAGVQLQSCDAGEDRWDRSESDSESLGLPLTLEEGPWIRGLDFEALDTSETNSPQEAMIAGDSSVEAGAVGSRSSVLAASQIEIRLDASSSFECRDSRSQALREGHALRDPGPSGSVPLEARDSAKKAPNAFRSPRRRPTLEHATPEPRRRPSGGELGATLRQEGSRAFRASSKESRSSATAKNQEGCASCPLSGTWTGRGEQQIRIRSFNFEMNDATASSTLEDSRKTSPRTFLPRVAVAKAKEASLPDAPERSQTLERSLSPAGSDRRSTSPCILPSNAQAPTRPAVPQSARGRHRRTSLTVPCSRAPATSMSLLSGDDLAESPRAPLHKNSTSLDSCADGPAESVGSGGEAATGFNSYEPVAASALPMASRDRQKFPSLLTATSLRPKTDHAEV
eukprot:s2693_g1.t1